MRFFGLLLVFLTAFSCIPYSFAPKIESYKVLKANKIKRNISPHHVFAFKDTKEANAFYDFLYMKYPDHDGPVNQNIEVTIAGRMYYMSFYECERSTNTVNILPMALDGVLASKDMDPVLEEHHTSRFGNWYILITIEDLGFKDGLQPNYIHQQKIVSFLNSLRQLYYATDNYKELLFKSK